MGGVCDKKCFYYEVEDPPSTSPLYEKVRNPSFMEHYCVEAVLKKTCSRILKEDKEHLFQNEEWFKDITNHNKNGKSFLDINKFMESYPHYRIDQAKNK